MLLEQIKGITPDEELEKEFLELQEKANKLLDKLNIIVERFDTDNDFGKTREMPPPPGEVEPSGSNMEDIVAAMDTVIRQLEAAKKGLGLVNKLPDSPSRTINRSRVMKNLNRIRGNLRRIEKMLATVGGIQ